MKVSKHSWHYKVWAFFHDERKQQPKDLCSYFWGIALPSFFCAGAVAGFAGLAGFLIYRWFIETHFGWGVLAVIALFVAVTAALWVICEGIERGVKQIRQREPGLIRSYLRAKKQKVCPLIEVTDVD